MKTPTVSVTEERYVQALDDSEGWCNTCNDFTRPETEPDARGYECPLCGEPSVLGAEEALMEDRFYIDE